MRYYATAILMGIREDLEAIYMVCSRIEECSAMVNNTSWPTNWLGNAVKNISSTYCRPDVLIEDVSWKEGDLALDFEYQDYDNLYDAVGSLVATSGVDAVLEFESFGGRRFREEILSGTTPKYPFWKLYSKEDLDYSSGVDNKNISQIKPGSITPMTLK